MVYFLCPVIRTLLFTCSLQQLDDTNESNPRNCSPDSRKWRWQAERKSVRVAEVRVRGLCHFTTLWFISLSLLPNTQGVSRKSGGRNVTLKRLGISFLYCYRRFVSVRVSNYSSRHSKLQPTALHYDWPQSLRGSTIVFQRSTTIMQFDMYLGSFPSKKKQPLPQRRKPKTVCHEH